MDQSQATVEPLTAAVEGSGSVEEAVERFGALVRGWMGDCMGRYDAEPATDVHDQLTYTTGWEPILRADGASAALNWLRVQRDRVAEHYRQSDQWKHGYWRRQEVHHGTEHFELFLGMMARLEPTDAETGRQLLDAVEHFGNWANVSTGVADIPDFFDWETGLFRSTHLGTDRVDAVEPHVLNLPDHFRGLNLARLCHQVDGDRRWMDLVARHGGRWVDAILDGERLPVALHPDGPIHAVEPLSSAAQQAVAGAAPIHAVDPEADPATADLFRAENLLASDAVNALLALAAWRGEDRARAAAARLVDVLVGQVDQPIAHAAAAAVRDYREATGERRYDEAVIEAGRAMAAREPARLTLDLRSAADESPTGIGWRADRLHWREDDHAARINPVTLALAGQITGEPDWQRLAVDLGRARLEMARRVLPDGRDHGCSSRSVSAVARGHGRENHAGMVTAVLGPVMRQMGMAAG